MHPPSGAALPPFLVRSRRQDSYDEAFAARRPAPLSSNAPAASEIAHAWAQVGAALSPHPDCPLPNWAGGGDTLHQHLLVIGAGHDTEMIDQLRHLETAAARFGKIGFVGPTEARRLVEWSMGERIVVLSRMPRNVSDWDLRCPLAALARTLGPQAAHAHAGRPFLRVTATAARHWRDRLAAAAQHGFCVGLAGWEAFDDAGTGRTDSSPHVSRPSSLSSLAPLLRVPGVSWVPLGCPGDDASSAMPPQSVDWIDWRADCDDLADEASLIDNLDLVIALDSAHGHLADGLGVPVWRLDAARITASQREGGGDTPFSPQRRATIDALSRFPLPCVADDWPGAVGAAADVLLAMATEFQGWTR